MKVAAYLLGLGVLAAGVSFGVAGLEAQQSTLMNYCPATGSPGNCAAAAVMLVSAGNPSDDELVAYITAIAGANGRSRGCPDTAAGLVALAGAIDNEATRALAQQVANQLCGRSVASADGPPIDLNAIVYGTTRGDSAPPAASSSGSSGQSSGSSGQTSSGASGNTSGNTSGDTSGGASSGTSGGASSGTSGTSGQSSGTSGQTSSGASGNTSSGASGNTSGNTSGDTSGGASSGTSGGASSGTSGTSGQSSGTSGSSGEG